jgi:hypothetical protein
MNIRKKKPPEAIKGCEYCSHRGGDFFKDPEAKEVIRCYCKARHVNVDAELMTKFCDFFEKNPEYKREENNKEGI